MNGYELSRQWFNFCFKNPQKVKPNHTALYFFAIEHCNRMGWKEIFGFPTTMAKDAIGIRSYATYKQTLDDLVEWGFIIMHEVSKNQYSSNIIALSNFAKAHSKAHDEALDKALITHASKQQQYIKTIEPDNNQQQTAKSVAKKQPTYEYPKSDTDPDLIEFFVNNGSTAEAAAEFYNHFNAQGWIRGNGQVVLDWMSQAKLSINKKTFGADAYNASKATTNNDDPHAEFRAKYGIQL